jgi:hypothetical protein
MMARRNLSLNRVVTMVSSEESDDEYTPQKPSDKSDSDNDLDQSKFKKNESKKFICSEIFRK